MRSQWPSRHDPSYAIIFWMSHSHPQHKYNTPRSYLHARGWRREEMRSNPGIETLATWYGLDHSSNSSLSLGKGWPQGLLCHKDHGLTFESEGRRLTPLWQLRQVQHTPRLKCFHLPAPSRKAPHKIPVNAAHRMDNHLHTAQSQPGSIKQKENSFSETSFSLKSTLIGKTSCLHKSAGSRTKLAL